jgi:hypothetical protein
VRAAVAAAARLLRPRLPQHRPRRPLAAAVVFAAALMSAVAVARPVVPGGGGRTWAGGSGWTGGGPRWHGHRHGRVFGPSVSFGFGGAYAGYPYGYPYYDDYYYEDYPTVTVAPGVVGGGDDVAYCQRRFRSYDINTGTYLGYDGQRHPCP